ncbi:MAG TPA: trypsin-like peptidase domain-containing protein [Acetobacteraceae bacterium]|jgi:serine protease Do
MPSPARSTRAEPRPAPAHCRGAVLCILLLIAACTATPHDVAARATPDSFAPLVKQVMPAVVNIAVDETVSGTDALSELPPELRDTPLGRALRRRLRDKTEHVMGTASGFVVDPSGIIVTNNHVVKGAEKIMVSLPGGQHVPARVLGTDELTDLAVIKIAVPQPLPHVAWGDSRHVEVGDWIIAAGNPFGLGGSVTAGIVSAEGRDLGSSPFDDFLQLDAPINPGNSGGPIFNMGGQVIGVSSVIVSPTGASVGIGFAIPSDIVRPIVEQLLAHGSIARGWLGVAVEDADNGSVTVAGLDRSGPALHAGVRSGDIVLAVNGEHIDSARNLIRTVAAMPPGTTVHLTVRRQGRDVEIPVTIGRRPPESAG